MMNEKKAQKRIEQLVNELSYHAERYYRDDAPVISDEVYDGLYQELVSLEQAFPHLTLANSPTQKVGGSMLEGFEKTTHTFPQWSFDNIFDWEGLQKWEQKILRLIEKDPVLSNEAVEYIVELKIDGLKIILDYDQGELTTGATRGDGTIGENITENVRMISSVPQRIREKKYLSIIGEAWIEKSELEAINQKRRESGLPSYANPRNLAAGTLRQLDTRVVKERNLQTFFYDLHSNEKKFETHEQELEFLKEQGFSVLDEYLKTTSIKEIQNYYQQWVEKRHQQAFGVDGLVIKINSKKINDALGYTAKSPRFAVAYKFPAEQVTTIIKKIELQIGRSGILTPVAILEPVLVDGSTVKRATLHNMDEVDRLGIKIGDTIVLEKAGDIIPKIKKVIPELRNGSERRFDISGYLKKNKIQAHSEVSDSGVTTWYVDSTTPEVQIRYLSYVVSKKALNIQGMGERHVRALYNAGYIKKVSDIYHLTYEQIISLPLFKEKSTNNLLDAINQSKQVSLPVFITALGIPHVGEEIAELYSRTFKNLDVFLKASYQDYVDIQGIGEQIASSTFNYLNHSENQKEISRLKKILSIEDVVGGSNRDMEDVSIVVTGTLKYFSRDEIKLYIKKHGGKLLSQISSSTDFLVVGDKAGSKLKQAQKLEVPVLSEEEFMEKFKIKK